MSLGSLQRGAIAYLEICIVVKKVVWCGCLEEGVTTDLYECELASWSREVTSLWHNGDNSWGVGKG